MIIDILLGAVAMWVLMFLVDYARREDLQLAWWHWTLTVLNIIYTIFVIEMIFGFLGEGVPQAAAVMGLLTGIAAVVWAVLLGRFVFVKKTALSTRASRDAHGAG